jgi:hypothetical protein
MHSVNTAAILAGQARQELPRYAASVPGGPGLARHWDDRSARDAVMRTAIVTNVLSAKGQAVFGMSVRV